MTKVSDRLSVEVDGSVRELFMPFALLGELVRVCPDIADMGSLIVNPDLQEKVLSIVLSQRNATGAIETPFAIGASQVTTDTVSTILEWVMENITDFFIRAAESGHRLQLKHAQRVQELMSSPAGSRA